MWLCPSHLSNIRLHESQAATTGEPARRHQRPSVTETSPARARTTAVRRAEVAVSERVGRVRRTP